MPPFGFCGGSYTSQSINAECQSCINFYPEKIESGAGPSRVVLYPTEGTKLFVTLTDGPVRGQIYTDALAFAVGGSVFTEIFANGSKTDHGIIANDGLPVSMAAGPNQILIASAGQAYVYTLATNVLAPIPPATLANVLQVGYCDGFFLALLKNSHTFQASALLDATTWPPLSTTTVNVFIDNVLAMLVDHREVVLFGITKSVVYYDSGNFPFPFDLVPGGFVEQGIVGGNTPVRLDNSIFWLGGDERGSGVAWRAQGYTPQRVSNHAVEFAWQGYARIDDAIGYSYQDQGHSFWVLYFPTANKTWVYDVASGMWHERAYWNAINGIYTAHRSQNHIFAFGKHLVGDWASGKIYEMSINFYSDSENPIRRVRRAPHVSKEQQWSFHSQMQVYLEPGLGPIPPLIGTSSSPSSFTLADSGGNLWTVIVNDVGLLTTVAGSGSAADTIILNDSVIMQSVQVGVTLGGLLTTTVVPYSASYSFLLLLSTTPSGFDISLTISSGLLQTSVPSPSPRDPMLNLRWSDDAGKTWSSEYTVGIGQAGEFKKRAVWRRLGRARDRVYEINCSDPIPYRVIDAYLEAS